jgi:hypothetical protein
MNGEYVLSLPAGVYTLAVRSVGYRPATSAPLTVVPGQTLVQDFVLERTPRILLVDAGAWYYGAEYRYFESALDALDYVYDERHVKLLPRDTPDAALLSRYDLVICRAPLARRVTSARTGDLHLPQPRPHVAAHRTGRGLLGRRTQRLLQRSVLRGPAARARAARRLHAHRHRAAGEVFGGLTITLGGRTAPTINCSPTYCWRSTLTRGRRWPPMAAWRKSRLPARGRRAVSHLSSYSIPVRMRRGAARDHGARHRLAEHGAPMRAIELTPGWEPLAGAPGSVRAHRARA